MAEFSVLRWNKLTQEWSEVPAGDLLDMDYLPLPAFSGNQFKYLRVNEAENFVEYVAIVPGDIGATTVGGNLFTLANPSAIRFIKINADNTVTARTAAQMLSDIGAQASGSYQATLVSGTNIKTVNSTSLLGSGDVDTTLIPYATGSFTVPTGYAKELCKTLILTSTQRVTMAGTARVSLKN